jgi:ElaB/YqjD/DUF883 family membrane-anchored ribosome-binding protein
MGHQQPDKSNCGGEVRQSIADTLQQAAESLGKAASGHQQQSGLAGLEKHVAEWLDQSATYVRQFDYEREQARAREHVTRHPGRSLLIAGAVGLALGALLRRR